MKQKDTTHRHGSFRGRRPFTTVVGFLALYCVMHSAAPAAASQLFPNPREVCGGQFRQPPGELTGDALYASTPLGPWLSCNAPFITNMDDNLGLHAADWEYAGWATPCDLTTPYARILSARVALEVSAPLAWHAGDTYHGGDPIPAEFKPVLNAALTYVIYLDDLTTVSCGFESDKFNDPGVWAWFNGADQHMALNLGGQFFGASVPDRAATMMHEVTHTFSTHVDDSGNPSDAGSKDLVYDPSVFWSSAWTAEILWEIAYAQSALNSSEGLRCKMATLANTNLASQFFIKTTARLDLPTVPDCTEITSLSPSDG
jgi:hypothetical protein